MGLSKEDIRDAEALWSDYRKAISRTLASYENDQHSREDLAHNVFLAILASMPRIRAAENPKAYVFRIAHNVAVDHVAKELRRNWITLPDEILDADGDPESEFSVIQERTRLLRAIQRLRLPYRQVMVLLMEGFKYSEIEDVLGISSGTVRIRVMRAKQRLQDLLGHD
jgi:RNA polymerase sigma-70 factor (ECF subfamily)